MAEIRIGDLTSSIEVTDTDSLLSPRVLAQIVQAVIEETERRERDAQSRDAQTRIGDGGGRR
ncbi:MAG: hypothetical protein HRU31_18915 [Rhodobacteraceae bacterium]|nr:hypothetical protein [Paracoccaceae bacterium]